MGPAPDVSRALPALAGFGRQRRRIEPDPPPHSKEEFVCPLRVSGARAGRGPKRPKAVAATIVGNNRDAVRELLASYHRIDDAQTHASFRIEQLSAAEWIRNHARSDAIAANRDAVIARGRSQIHE